MKIRPLGANRTEITDGDLTVLVSYQTPVLYHISGQRPVITSKQYSRTTSKHISQWLTDNDFDRERCNVTSPANIAEKLCYGRLPVLVKDLR